MSKILELQNELADIIIEYDAKIKHNLDIEARYNLEMPREISEVTTVENQIAICNAAIKMAKEGKTFEETQKVVTDLKQKAINFIMTTNRKLKDYKMLEEANKNYSKEELDMLETEYAKLVKEHHPAIVIRIPQTYDMQFKILRNFYLLNNVKGFMNLLKESPVDNIVINRENEEFVPKYEEYINAYKNEFARVKKFDERFTKLEEILNDDIMLGRNQMVLRERGYKAKQAIGELFALCDKLFDGKLEYKIKWK